MSVRILEGNAIDVLATLQAGSVHCCVTSPPYWGLRDYGVEPSVWGGDPDCRHEFGDELSRTLRGGVGDKSTLNGGQLRSGACLKAVQIGSLCRCGAWRGCLGLEPTPEMFIENMVAVFREVRRVLRDDGTLWLNIGDCYCPSGGPGVQGKRGATADRIACQNGVRERRHEKSAGCKPKDLVGIPWMLAFALRADGWYLRQDIIWHKPNPMPESVTDRCTSAFEHVFLLSKSPRYFFDQEAIRLPPSGISGGACFGGPMKEAKGKALLGSALRQQQRAATREDRERYATVGANARSVWTIPTFAFPQAHFATFPPRLAEQCISAGTAKPGCCPACLAPWRRNPAVKKDL